MFSARIPEQVVVSYDPSRLTPISSLIPYAKGEIRRFDNFPVLAFRCYARNVDKIKALRRVMYVHVPQFPAYVRIIEEVDAIIQRGKDGSEEVPSVMNLSVSHGPRSYSPLEPMNLATCAGARQGLVFVFAVGNDGPNHDTLSPWSVAPWAIGVGAVDKDGKRLWEHSSVGKPGDDIYHPTVVAHGIEVPVPGIDILEPEKKHGSYVIWLASGMEAEPGEEMVHVTGTSFATAQVSRICGYIVEFIEYLELIREEATLGNGYYGCETYYEMLRELQTHNLSHSMTVSSRTVKRVLEAMAIPVEGYDVYQVGAGFVNDHAAIRYLTNFSARDFVQVFCSEGAERTLDAWLAEHQDSLVPRDSIDYVVKLRKEKRQLIDIPIV